MWQRIATRWWTRWYRARLARLDRPQHWTLSTARRAPLERSTHLDHWW